MSFRAMQTIIQISLALIILSQIIVVPFSSLYLKYLNFSVLQMGMVRAVHTWVALIFESLWIKVTSQITKNSIKRTGIIGAIFATIVMCLCFSLVPPYDVPVSVTHCVEHTVDPYGGFSLLNIINDSLSTDMNNMTRLQPSEKTKKILEPDLQNDTTHSSQKNSFNLTYVWKNYEKSRQAKHNIYLSNQKSAHFKMKPTSEFDIENRNIERVNPEKIFNPKHLNSDIYNTARNNEERDRIIDYGAKNLQHIFKIKPKAYSPKQENIFSHMKKIDNDLISKISQTKEENLLLRDENKYNDENSYYRPMRYKQRKYLHRRYPILFSRQKRDILYHNYKFEEMSNNYMSGNVEGRGNLQSEGSVTTDCINCELLNKKNEGKSNENVTIISKQMGNKQSVVNSEFKLKSLFVLSKENFLISQIFVTVLVLTIFYEMFSSQTITWIKVFCKHYFEEESDIGIDKLFLSRISIGKSTLMITCFPLLAIIIARTPCPYQIAYHYLVAALSLGLVFILVLFFLPLHTDPVRKGFRRRKPSKPPVNNEQRQKVHKIFCDAANIIMGVGTACCSEFIMWHVQALEGFPFNYEYIFCGYYFIGTLAYVLAGKVLQRCNKRIINQEESDSEEEEIIHFAHIGYNNTREWFPSKNWIADIYFIISSLLLSLVLCLTPLLKSAWHILILSVLKGCSDAIFEAAIFNNSLLWEFAYGLGCLLGSVITATWNIKVFFYSAAIFTLSCSIILVMFSVFLHSDKKSYIHISPNDDMNLLEERVKPTEDEQNQEGEEDWLEKALQCEQLNQVNRPL